MAWSLSFDPSLPWWLLATGLALALAITALALVRRMRGALLRGVAFLALLAALTDPSVVEEERRPLPSVVAVVSDRSGSQTIETRGEDTRTAAAALAERLRAFRDIDVREIATEASGTDGTRLFSDIARGLADVPPERIAGVITVTDGIIHDIPGTAAELPFRAPFHAMITGHEDEIDRRIAIVSAPKFGLVGSTQEIRVRVDDDGTTGGGPVSVTLRRDGEEIARVDAVPGTEVPVEVTVDHGSDNIFEFETSPLEGELSAVNNRAVAIVKGIRENLRVLLVSGEPHVGERTWRNLLKSDASVDLVHFTILRPPEKQDGTPINELSLIAFPTRELFSTKIDEFDLIIFDRYQSRGVLPLLYFDNIAQFVRKGGAILIAAGPDYSGSDSLYDTPLSGVLPAAPTGNDVEEPYRAAITDIGKRHPVTRDLPGSDQTPPAWSRWFRIIDAAATEGDAVMSGPGDRPLLLLAHEDEGRVAMLLSDQVWLWARGFEGGGPHVQLLRRLAHWLMKEPDLEEESLRLMGRGGRLEVERQTLGETAEPVTVTLPGGETRTLPLQAAAPGIFRADMPAPALGLYAATDGTLRAITHVGPTDPKEFRLLRSSMTQLEPIAEATGGTVQRLKDTADGAPAIPRIVPQQGASSFGGDGWMGLRMSDAYEVTGISRLPLFNGLLGLALLLGVLGTMWYREGR
ncbi:hypothetical protein [Methylobrevis pamukkalensis]|uniref:Glutamine amidotransferase domain-containing protein n=1 Tax=Methylobrevis pamukkalensis TaxID=1439726 RepID=A0A1E3H027_9HYPH|nr:hypothetical protein [Methylobrevis pamukkalensis]ODN69642.1 hypothetical protein A6302_03062 [Methylobrevis pamukkalensis]